jgi:hypothetical protein
MDELGQQHGRTRAPALRENQEGEQRLIEGQIVAGQKVRHFRPRAVDLVAPLKQDLAEHRLRMGRPRRPHVSAPRRTALAAARLPELAPSRLA